MRRFLTATALCVAAFAHRADAQVIVQPAGDPKPGAIGVPAAKPFEFTVQGQIFENDPLDPVRQKPSKVHAVKLAPGKNYQIDLVSGEFDSYLRFESSDGTQLDANDDGGEGLNSKIVFRAEKEDVYKVIATTFAGGVGAYTLTVKEIVGKQPGVRPAPVQVGKLVRPLPIPLPGQVAQPGPVALPEGTKFKAPTDKPFEAQGQIDDNSPKDPVRGRTAAFFTVTLEPGTAYRIDHASDDFDAFLWVADAKGKMLDQNDDSNGTLNSQIIFFAPEKGEYRIVATSLGGGRGAFNLTVTAEGKFLTPDAKKTFEPEKAGKTLTIGGRLVATDPLDRVQAQSHCHVHQFKMPAGKTFVVDLISGSMDAFLRIEDEQGNELASDDDSGEGLNSRIAFTPPAAGTFRIIATSLSRATGGYMLKVAEQQ